MTLLSQVLVLLISSPLTFSPCSCSTLPDRSVKVLPETLMPKPALAGGGAVGVLAPELLPVAAGQAGVSEGAGLLLATQALPDQLHHEQALFSW